MKTQFLITLAAAAPLALAQQPAQPQPQPQPQQRVVSAAESIINQMGITTDALLDVLQGVTDKASADAAAREVGELIVQLKLLNDLAGYAPDYVQDIEAMRQAQVNALMPMLINTNPCYGSEAMLKALAPVVTIRPVQQPVEVAQPQPQPQPQPAPQPEPQALPQPQPQPQPAAQEPPAQQLAEAILEGYKDLTTVLKGVQDKASADAAAPQAAQVIAGILPLYDEAEETEGMADVVGVQIAQTQEISDLADLLETLLQTEPPLYGSEALSNVLAQIVTVEDAPEEEAAEEQEPADQEQAQPALQPVQQQAAPAQPSPQPAFYPQPDEEEEEVELAPSEILAPAPQA